VLFTEPTFLFLYLPVVLALYFTAPRSVRGYVLTLASVVFYAVGEWAFLPWLLASTAASYFIAIGLDRWRGTPTARVLLVGGIAIDLALLVVFKYAAFITSNFNELLRFVGMHKVSVPHIALPLGISFFTFHKISYKIDIARGVAEVRRNPFDLFLYIALFPQLVAGPIVRYHEIAGELAQRTHRLDDFAAGVRRFMIGFAKKMLVANTVALCADTVFAVPAGQLTFGLAWLGVISYTIQIYVDFSAYSDMAIGLARMFGFHFPENFNYPYISTSITEFWRRWHMTLSRWFRDYLYIPLGGNRLSPQRTLFNLMVVFVLCGFWHGATWNFLIWGVFHGGLLIVERIGLGSVLERVPLVLRHGYTMLLVMIGWVFFRADTLAHARVFLRSMVGLGPVEGIEHSVARYLDRPVQLALVVGVIISMPTVPMVSAWIEGRRPVVDGVGRVFAVLAIVSLFLLGAMQVASDTYNPFIYFRF
jgi:alginate O-acetyltransferase complex protein AlgI